MAKFVELHYITTGSLLVNCEQIRMVETIKDADGCKVLVGDIPAATSFYAKEKLRGSEKAAPRCRAAARAVGSGLERWNSIKTACART